MKPPPLWQRLTVRHLLALFPISMLFALALTPIDDTDVWWHLRAGEWMLEHRAIPRVGLWSWIGEQRPWVTHEWLFEVGAAALLHLAGPRGLIVAKALLVAAAFALVFRHARRRSDSVGLAAVVTFVAGVASTPFWAERPQMLTYLLTACFLLVLDSWHRGERTHLWVLPPLVMLWANLHGAFVLAFALIGIHAVGEVTAQAWQWWRGDRVCWARVRHLVAVAGVSLLLSLVNPHGPELLLYPFRYFGAPTLTRFVIEWFSPDFRNPRMLPSALFLLATLAALSLSPRRPRAPQLLLVLFLSFAALYSRRNLPLMIIGLAPVLAEHLRALWDQADRVRARFRFPARDTGQIPLANWLLLAGFLAFTAVSFPKGNRWEDLAITKSMPVGAVRYLKDNYLPGRMFNYYNWGGYLLWDLCRQCPYKVFIDGRADLYGDEIIQDFVDAHYGKPNWRTVLDKYRIDWVLWQKEGILAQILRASPDWQVQYEDKTAVIFVRRR